jgi:hypothetical protein
LSTRKKRYPIEEKRYQKSVGALLPHRIGQIFEELGFNSWITNVQTNGVDLIIRDLEGHIILVAEIQNWSSHSGMARSKIEKKTSNLLEYDCDKLLIYTVFKNEDILVDLCNQGIHTLKIDFQLLPRSFYEYFASKNQVEHRRIDSRETKLELRLVISKYLEEKGILSADSSQFVRTFQTSNDGGGFIEKKKLSTYEEVTERDWSRWIRAAKEVCKDTPCLYHCPECSRCKKFSDMEKKKKELKGLFQPKLGESVEEARMELHRLRKEYRPLLYRIKNCIHIKKSLAEKGYNTWMNYLDTTTSQNIEMCGHNFQR